MDNSKLISQIACSIGITTILFLIYTRKKSQITIVKNNVKSLILEKKSSRGNFKNDYKIKNLKRIFQLKPNEILVKISHSTLMLDDIKMCEGTFPMQGAKNPSVKKPYIAGHELSGKVELIGTKVSRFNIDDNVFGFTFDKAGAISEYCILREKYAHIKPHNWTYKQACATPVSSVVVKDFLTTIGINNLKNKIIVVIGASGAVGSVLVKLLVSNEAIVYGVCSTSKSQLITELGASVLDQTKAPFDKQLLNNNVMADYVCDCIGGQETEDQSYRILKNNGGFYTLLGPSKFGEEMGNLKSIFVIGWRIIKHKFSGASYHFIISLDFSLKKLPLGNQWQPLIDNEYEFSEKGIKECIDRVMSHRAAGRCTIKIQDL